MTFTEFEQNRSQLIRSVSSPLQPAFYLMHTTSPAMRMVIPSVSPPTARGAFQPFGAVQTFVFIH